MLVKFQKTWYAKTTRHFRFRILHDFFCFGVWHNFNSFSLKVQINATCCLHRTEIAPKKVIFHRWEVGTISMKMERLHEIQKNKEDVYNKVIDILVRIDETYGFCTSQIHVKHSMKLYFD